MLATAKNIYKHVGELQRQVRKKTETVTDKTESAHGFSRKVVLPLPLIKR